MLLVLGEKMKELRDSKGLTEAEAIARYQAKNYPKPALTADILVFTYLEEKLHVLLVKRGGHPFMGRLALPGGFANKNEPVEETAARELEEETGVSGLELELVGIFSAPGRDPRGWTVSAAYMSVVNAENLQVQAGDDAAEAAWFEVCKTTAGIELQHGESIISAAQLAFDHGDILEEALKQIDSTKENK